MRRVIVVVLAIAAAGCFAGCCGAGFGVELNDPYGDFRIGTRDKRGDDYGAADAFLGRPAPVTTQDGAAP